MRDGAAGTIDGGPNRVPESSSGETDVLHGKIDGHQFGELPTKSKQEENARKYSQYERASVARENFPPVDGTARRVVFSPGDESRDLFMQYPPTVQLDPVCHGVSSATAPAEDPPPGGTRNRSIVGTRMVLTRDDAL